MGRKTWIYLIILIAVLAAAGIFFWWNYKSGQVKPKAETPATEITQTFSDVSMGDPNNNYQGQYWAFNQIESVYKKGWMIGWDWKEFRPEENATRATVAVAIARAYGKTANPDTPSFTDVPKDYWAYQEIEGLKAAGYISGYGDGSFKPDQAADRGTVAGFVAKAHANGTVPAPGQGNPHFSDCTAVATCTFFNEIEYLAGLDIISGFGDGTYRADTLADRQTVAVVIAKDKALNIANPPAEATFFDVAKTSTNYAYIEAVNTANYMTGYPTKVFRPDLEADRATLAVAIARATNNLFDNTGNPTFSDVPKDYWAYKEIEGMNKAGIMVGFSGGAFCPDTEACSAEQANATRTSVAIVLARAKNLTLEPNGKQVFADVAPGSEGYAEINAISKAGYTNGCGQSDQGQPLYCPTQTITRAVLAAFIYNGFVLTSPTLVTVPSTGPSAITSNQGTTGTTTTTTAQTGAELPLVGGGLISLLFLGRYLIGKRIR